MGKATEMLEGFIEVTPIMRCGVYALVRDGVVVYIGQSKRMLQRIATHFTNWGRNTKKNALPAWMMKIPPGVLFDQVYVLPCRIEDLDEVERTMIDLYKPKYNIKLKTPDRIDVPMVMTILGRNVPFNQPAPKFERRI